MWKKLIRVFKENWAGNGINVNIKESSWEHDGLSHRPPWVTVSRDLHLQGAYPSVKMVEYYPNGTNSGTLDCAYNYDSEGNVKVHMRQWPGCGEPISAIRLIITR